MKILKENGLPFSRFCDSNYGSQVAPDVVSTHQVNQPIINPISNEFDGMRNLFLHTGMVLSNVKGQTFSLLNVTVKLPTK